VRASTGRPANPPDYPPAQDYYAKGSAYVSELVDKFTKKDEL
jgi:hypothetical protein